MVKKKFWKCSKKWSESGQKVASLNPVAYSLRCAAHHVTPILYPSRSQNPICTPILYPCTPKKFRLRRLVPLICTPVPLKIFACGACTPILYPCTPKIFRLRRLYPYFVPLQLQNLACTPILYPSSFKIWLVPLFCTPPAPESDLYPYFVPL